MPALDADPSTAASAAAYRRFFDELRRRFPEREHLVETLELALLSREHLLWFGPPGTGKSELAATALRHLVDGQGKPSLYSRQIVETTVQQDLIGPVDFKVLTETGRTQHRVDEGLLAFEHALLDEAFDARDLLLRSLFSVLHERELAVGPQVFKARLSTAIFTTNRYLSELLAARPETLLAFSDRVAFSAYVPKGFVSGGSRLQVLAAAAGRGGPMRAELSLADLATVRALVARVEVDDDALAALGVFADLFEKALADPGAEGRKQPPTRYLSARALVKAVGIWKAAIVRDRLSSPRAAELEATAADLALLRPFFTLAGPPTDQLTTFAALTTDPRDQAQLRLVAAEQQAFARALKEVQGQLKQDLQKEAAALGLAEIFRPDMAANRTLVASLAASALRKARHAKHRDQLSALLRHAAAAYVAEGPTGEGGAAQLERVEQLKAMVDGLRTLGDEALAQRVATAARDAVRAEVLAVPLREAAEELESVRAPSLKELAAQAQRRIDGLASAEKNLSELAGLAGEELLPDVAALLASARARTAQAIRRRVGWLFGRTRTADLAALPAEMAPLAEIDGLLAQLSPGAGRLRQDLISARATALLRRELTSAQLAGPTDLLDFVREAERRLRTLELDPAPVLRGLRHPVILELTSRLGQRPSPAAPTGPCSEEGYLRLIAQCPAAGDRATLQEVIALVGAEHDPSLVKARAQLEEQDADEVAAQVRYLEQWFAQVAGSIPPPGELANLAQAESAWAAVSASRFFRQAWRDQELVTLRERIRELAALPSVAARAEATLIALDNLLRQSEHFGRALLDRRAALASAA